jgi:hypothetical protein
MKRILIFGLFVLLCGPAEAAEVLPKALRGLWVNAPADCANPDSDGRLAIAARTVSFYAAGYDITRVVRRRDGSLRASGLVSNEGEVGRTRDSITLKLMAPGQLRVGTEDPHIYRRCPKQ